MINHKHIKNKIEHNEDIYEKFRIEKFKVQFPQAYNNDGI